jgi:hypothetical protein
MEHTEIQRGPSICDESKRKLAQVYHLLWLLAQQADGSVGAKSDDNHVDVEADAVAATA